MRRVGADIVIGLAIALFSAVAAIALRYLSPTQIFVEEVTWQHGVFSISAIGSYLISRVYLNAGAAIRYAISVASVFIGFVSALLLREAFIGGAIDYNLAGLAFWVALLIISVWWKEWVDFWKVPRPGHIAFLIAFASTFVLGTYPAFAWNTLISAPLNLYALSVDGAPLAAAASGLYDLLERGDLVINWTTLLLSAVTAAGAYYSAPILARILEYVQLNEKEVLEAKRWRRPAREAISASERLDTLYPQRLHIETWKLPPEVVFDSRPTIVRIYIPPRTPLDPSNTQPGKVSALRKLLDKHGRNLERSLIILYQHHEQHADNDASKHPRIVAYGFGTEFKDLFQNSNFAEQLCIGDTQTIIKTVEQHRHSLLGLQSSGGGVPLEHDVLLGTAKAAASDPLRDVLEVMGAQNYRRILVVDDQEPYAFGVLSADKFARYLA
jgi:hypothetical protein